MKMNKEIIGKYLNNTCTRDELEQVLAWLSEKAGPEGGKSLLYEFFKDSNSDTWQCPADLDALLNRIHHQVNKAESEKLMASSRNNPVRYRRRQAVLTTLRNAAAFLLLPVVGLSLFLILREKAVDPSSIAGSQVFYEVKSSVDAITRISLPDGSQVWLNRGSSLRYPAVFKKDMREVYLTGEGYFAVGHNPKVPFVVYAGELSVAARGTEFNIMAYPDDDQIEMSLASGVIELFRENPGTESVSLLTLKPAELAVFRKSVRQISVFEVPDDRYYAWKDGKLIFNNESMDVVVRKLSRWFNVDIEVRDPKLLELSYTATFINESLTQVLELMALATPVRYSVIGRKEIGNGEYSKLKIILRKTSN